jgi:PTH1 family peptidyl-tRNA hydrolase
MYVFAGLGNPDAQYADTRHNAGFNAVDTLHEKLSAQPWKSSKGALIAQANYKGNKVLLVKPQKYMNNSGEVLSAVMAYYKLDTDKLIVMYDDIDLGLGKLRIRKSGGAGTHNGMRNIVLHLGEGFGRIRIGVDKPKFGDLADYVLAKPKNEEKQEFDKATVRAAEAAESIIINGLDKTMAVFNV